MRVPDRLEAWLFEPGSAFRLGVCRAGLYGWLLFQLSVYEPVGYASLPPELWAPVPPLAALGMAAPSVAGVSGVLWIARVALVLACLGLATRLATIVAAAAAWLLIGLMNSYGAVNNHLSPLVILAVLLALSPCGDGFSLDARLGRRPPRRDSGAYTWPIRLAWLTLVGFMFAAGLQKLLGGWLADPALPIQHFLRFKYYVHSALKGVPVASLALQVAAVPWLCALLGTAATLLELASPLALFPRWPRMVALVVGGLFLFQAILSLGLHTFPSFPWAAAYLFWVPWDRWTVPARPEGGRPGQDAPTRVFLE